MYAKFSILQETNNLRAQRTMATMNISIPDEMREWVEIQIKSGHYANASDYLRDLIRHNQSEVEAIRLALIEGEQSGVSDMTINKVIAKAKRKLKK
jgi:antitoxin ParD1/3/4